MSIVGKVIEVGKMDCCPTGSNGNVVVIEIVPGQLIRVSGMSDAVLRWLAQSLYQNVGINFYGAEP